MTNEELKNIWILTTKHMPVFNYDDKRFDYYVNLLDKLDRLNMIRETLGNADYDALLNEREAVIEHFDNLFHDIELEKKLLSVKFSYPLNFVEKNEYVDGDKYVQVDLKDAAIGVLNHFNILDCESWDDMFDGVTNNQFLRNEDENLRIRAVYGKNYVPHVVFDYPPFDMCYKQLLYDSYVGGLNQFMEEHGCTYTKFFRDALRYTIVDEGKFSTFKNDWGSNEYKSFGDIWSHYFISTAYSVNFYVPESHKTKKVIDVVTENGEHIVSRKTDEYYPQYKKLLMGLEVTDDDLYYKDNEKKSGRVQML